MPLRVITSTGLRYLSSRIFQYSQEKRFKFLTLIAPQFSRSCKNFSVSADSDIFDTVYVQNYLNYIVRTDLGKNIRTQDTEQLHQLLESKRELENEIKNVESMSSEGDKELQNLIQSEKKQYLDSIEQIKSEILYFISPPGDENDSRNIEMRIVGGIGGEEAKLFSEELFNMYINYAKFKNWECTGSFEDGFIIINGENVFGHLKNEAGVHRVQRVPITETSGRVQSSTCSVIILPQPKPYEIKIPYSDIAVEKLKSSGPGGQNVNKRETCIRIKHLPTGITVENQTSRYQQENLKEAISRLRGILFNLEQEKIISQRKSFIKKQAGTNDYSDKIRTYNFPQNRVTDHRINYSIQNLRGFLSGGKQLDDIIKKVEMSNMKKELLLHIKNILDSAEYKAFENKQAG